MNQNTDQPTKLIPRIQQLGAYHALQNMPRSPWRHWTPDQRAAYDQSYTDTMTLIGKPVTTPGASVPIPEPA